MRLPMILLRTPRSVKVLGAAALISAATSMACGNTGSVPVFESAPNPMSTSTGGTTVSGGTHSGGSGALQVSGGSHSGGALETGLGGSETGGGIGSGGADIGVGGSANSGGTEGEPATGGAPGAAGGTVGSGGASAGGTNGSGGMAPSGGSTATGGTATGGGSPMGPKVVINEIRGNAPDFVELYNVGDAPANISGYYVTDDANGDPDLNNPFIFPANTILPAHAYLVVLGVNGNVNGGPLPAAMCEDVGADCYKGTFAISNDGETVYLLDSNQVISDAVAFPADIGTTYGRSPNGTGAFATTSAATPKAPNP